LPEVDDCDDVRMTQPGQSLSFTGESFREAGHTGNFGRKHLERHKTVQTALARFVNGAHAAAPNQSQYLKLREQISQRVGVGR
jgi:hypothetical protein